jgi:hypothetical protein
MRYLDRERDFQGKLERGDKIAKFLERDAVD